MIKTEGKCCLKALVSGTSEGSVEDAEARGQQDLVNSFDLPIDMGGADRKEVETKTGIIFADDINDMFVRVVLPDEWAKVATDHSMWSMLVDEKGRVRASIFYKAAFYGRSAHMHFEPFWRVDSQFIDHRGVNRYRSNDINPDFDETRGEFELCAVKNVDGETFCDQLPVRRTSFGESNEIRRASYAESGRARQACVAWLDENKPDWKDPFAYWKDY